MNKVELIQQKIEDLFEKYENAKFEESYTEFFKCYLETKSLVSELNSSEYEELDNLGVWTLFITYLHTEVNKILGLRNLCEKFTQESGLENLLKNIPRDQKYPMMIAHAIAEQNRLYVIYHHILCASPEEFTLVNE